MRSALLQLQKFGTRLNPFEWVLVLVPPAFISISFRYLAPFYIAVVLVGMVAVYSMAAGLDYYHYQQLKKRNKRKKITPKLHYIETMQLGLLSLLLAFIYLTR